MLGCARVVRPVYQQRGTSLSREAPLESLGETMASRHRVFRAPVGRAVPHPRSLFSIQVASFSSLLTGISKIRDPESTTKRNWLTKSSFASRLAARTGRALVIDVICTGCFLPDYGQSLRWAAHH